MAAASNPIKTAFRSFINRLGYDIVGVRWDSTHADNMVVFEKNLVE